MYNDQNMCMDWDDAIESDGQEYVLLEEGDYNFQVVDFERGRFPGSAKIPPCNKAALTLQVKTADGKIATIKSVHSSTALPSFIVSISVDMPSASSASLVAWKGSFLGTGLPSACTFHFLPWGAIAEGV